MSTALIGDTRSRILQAAAKTFAAHGFRAATMKQIAAEARVNDITVYRYFPKKNQLYWAAIEGKIQSSKLVDVVSECVLLGSSPRSLLRNLGERLMAVFLDDPDLGRLIYFTVLELPEEKKKLYKKHINPLLTSLQALVESWVRSGEIRTVDPHSAMLAIVGIIWSPFNLREVFGLELRDPGVLSQLAEDCAEMCVQGLKVRTPGSLVK